MDHPPKPPLPLLPPPPQTLPATRAPAPVVHQTSSSDQLPQPRLGYGAVADPHSDFYQMLQLDPRASLAEIEEALRLGIRWWNGQQANPKYRHLAPEALTRLREARETLLDPMQRQTYDRSLQAFRHAHREARWHPIRDLIDVLLIQGRCSVAQEDLIIRYAQKRGLIEEEIERLLEEEFLRRGLKRPVRHQAHERPQHSDSVQTGYRVAITLMFLSGVGLFVLPFLGKSRSSVLLMLPLLNNIRLLFRGLTLAERTQEHDAGGWEWFSGIAIFGGATTAALLDLWTSSLFPFGLGIVTLLWLSWLQLVLLWRHTPPRPQDPFDPEV
ncbi:MAG: hypothetical protein H6728_17585 [Myxococcales bacterium]|nr:hypothetical protein [Myxococcales bacterium]MCB9644887.1 hypothetical protein [Myxococcales bacterium]